MGRWHEVPLVPTHPHSPRTYPSFLPLSSPSIPQPAGSLVSRCRTLDQARAVVTFLDAASEKTLRSTVALTASRGRGKVG